MESAFSRLLKVLALERKQGYQNKAVIGGLDKFASRWETDARAEVGQTAAVGEIVALLIGYPAIGDPVARERIIEQIARRAREAAPGGAPPAPAGEPSPAPPPPAAPVQPERPPELAAALIAEPPPAEPPEPAREPSVARPAAPGPAGEPPAGKPMPALSKPDVPPPARPAVVETPPAGAAPAVPLAAAPAARTRRDEPPDEPDPARAGPVFARGVAVGHEASLMRLPGVGPGFAARLAKMGVRTVRDLLYLLPRRYEDLSQLRTIDRLKWGEQVTVIGTVWKISHRIIGEDRRIVTAVVGDGTGEMEMSWFNPFVERRLQSGRAYTFGGKVESYRDRLVMRNPEFEPLERGQVHTGRLTPIYPLTEGITAHWLRTVMHRAVESFAAETVDFLPEALRAEAGLMPLADAVAQIHFPDNWDTVRAAHRRLSFDEFLLLQLGVLSQRQRFRGQEAQPLRTDDALLAPFLARLPFTLTGAQRRALTGVTQDLAQARPMSRLLQGDVGSGKTAVAAAALWLAVANGCQGAIMAPTEILAEQHARSFARFFAELRHPFSDRPVQVALLTGRTRRAERDQLLAGLAAGHVDVIVGTQALIQEEIAFRNLALAVVDEQHRFGVAQRAALRRKGLQPHVLVMSATPIPRSLALTLYGDLDLSVIDEMPAGRTPIKTKWLSPGQRERAYDFIRRQVAAGRQAFIVYPLVEESDRSEARAAVEEHERLQAAIFPGLRLGLLHGRLPGDEKEATMRAFSAGELDVLVATSVVEVGIDVPNATVIMIEGAERFGLAQLHQFRGRVGRGAHPAYCILVSAAADSEGSQRLQALETNNDGFALAQIDLDMRGPGDFFGARQSGLPPLRTAQLSDLRTLEQARDTARRIFAVDPALARPEHAGLAAQVAAFWRETTDLS
jgi:ATP-dependent DNA helicase RecG